MSKKQPWSVQGSALSGALLPCSFPTLSNPAPLLAVSLHQATDLESDYPSFLPAYSAISLSRKLSEQGSATVHTGKIRISSSQRWHNTLCKVRRRMHPQIFPCKLYYEVTIPKRSSFLGKGNPGEENTLFPTSLVQQLCYAICIFHNTERNYHPSFSYRILFRIKQTVKTDHSFCQEEVIWATRHVDLENCTEWQPENPWL